MGTTDTLVKVGASPDDSGERGMFLPAVAVFAGAPVPVGLGRLPPAIAEPAGVPAGWRLPALPRAVATLAARAAPARSLQLAVSTELDRGTAFILAPVFLATGALGYFSMAEEPGLVPLVTGMAVLAPLVLAARSLPVIQLALTALLLCLAGIALGKAETWRAGTRMLGAEISTELTGRVAAIEHTEKGRVRLTIDVASTARPVLRYVPDRVRVSARKVPVGIEAGSLVSGLVRLLPPSGPVRPGSYDFSFESYFDGIGASGFFLRDPKLVGAAGPAAAGGFATSVQRIREAVAERVRERIGGPEGEIAAALVVGVRAGIPEEINDALRRAGIYHIISISGLHMALVAGTIMGLLRFGFACFPGFSSRWPVKKLAALLAIAGLAGYLFISGGEVAAQRSFIMLAIMLTAVLFDRAALTLRNLAISAIVVILVSPHEVVGPSFQMSFAATAALVGAYAAWSDYRAGHPAASAAKRGVFGWTLRKLLLAAVGLAATSLIAGGATVIYAAWHFQQLPSLGLLTNLTAMPIVSLVVMPFAVLGMISMPLGLDGPFFDVMGWGLGVTIAIASWFAERSPVDVVGLVSPGPVIVLTAALLIAAVCTTWLRAMALPVAMIGLLMLWERPHADLLVSEDARLVGLGLGDGRVAVNRARPNEFTIDNWQRALIAETLVVPEKPTAPAAQASAPPGSGPSATESPAAKPGASEVAQRSGFVCADGLCLARHPSGAVVAHAVDATVAAGACQTAKVIIVDDATARDICRGRRVLVVTKRDLSRRGSAAISFNHEPASELGTAGNLGARIEFAIRQPYRPWHEHRRFSREARGLAPYRRASAVQAEPAAIKPISPRKGETSGGTEGGAK